MRALVRIEGNQLFSFNRPIQRFNKSDQPWDNLISLAYPRGERIGQLRGYWIDQLGGGLCLAETF